MPYGAFVDLGGIDGLLHVSDMSHTRVNKPEDVVSVGQQIQVRILKIDPESKKLSLGLKQLQPEPWATVPERFQVGQRVSGTVTRLQDFGAFVEIEPGVEGLIHISEMSWGKKIRHPRDVVKAGRPRRCSHSRHQAGGAPHRLGLKQTLADPWLRCAANSPKGRRSRAQSPRSWKNSAPSSRSPTASKAWSTSAKSWPTAASIIPATCCAPGQVVQALVLAIDTEKRQIKLSMKQLIPTSIDEYIAEHKAGDKVSGRVVEVNGGHATIELGEGIRAQCRAAAAAAATVPDSKKPEGKADLSSLTSLLSARWKGNAPTPAAAQEPLAEAQIRSFKIVKLDAATKKIEVELA